MLKMYGFAVAELVAKFQPLYHDEDLRGLGEDGSAPIVGCY